MRHVTRTICALAIFDSGVVSAQSLDYAALEQLFGEPVTTSVTGSPQRAGDVPASMEIISAADIRRSGARDLPGILRHVAGVDVLQHANDHADVSVRGYNQVYSPRLLVLVDGRQVYGDYYGFTPWTTIPVEIGAIRQIEVVKGPNSALFGFNAVGGVINIITYHPINDAVSSASVTAGTQDLIQASAVSGWHFGNKAGLRMSVGSRRNDDYSTPQRPFDVGTRRGNERNAVSLDGALRVTDNVQIDLEATYSDSAQVELGPVYVVAHTLYETNSIKGHVAADTSFGMLEGTVYTNRITSDAFVDVATSPFISLDSQVTVAKVQSLTKIATSHTLRLSAEYRDNTLGTTPLRGADVFYEVISVGSMWEWNIKPALMLTNAVRVDRLSLGRSGFVPPNYGLTNEDWDRTLTETSFNTGVVWRVRAGDTVRFTVARGVQLPSLFNLGGLLVPAPFVGYVTGIPTISPAVVTNYEVAWDRSLPSLSAALHISAFHGATRNIVANVGGVTFLPVGLLFTPANIGKSEVTGLEMSIKGPVGDRWRWGVSYTPMIIDDDFAPGFTVLNTFVDFDNTLARRVLNGNVAWSRGPWEVDGYLRYQSDFGGIETLNSSFGAVLFSAVLVPIPSYVSIDARVAYELNDRMTLALAGQNLGQSEQRQTSSPEVERRLLGTFSISF